MKLLICFLFVDIPKISYFALHHERPKHFSIDLEVPVQMASRKKEPIQKEEKGGKKEENV